MPTAQWLPVQTQRKIGTSRFQGSFNPSPALRASLSTPKWVARRIYVMRSFAIGGHSLATCPHWNAGADSPRNAHAGLLSPLPHSFRDCTGGRGGVRVLQFVRSKRDYDSFLAVPIQIGKRPPPSMFVVRVLLASSTDHVPILAIIPCTTDLFSSAVPWFTLLAANLGISEREIMNE